MANKENYLKKMELHKQQVEAGLVSERFPKVTSIVIQMTYFHNAENPVLMERTVNYFPTSHAYFIMGCMEKTCENGGYNLTQAIKKQIKNRKKLVKGEMQCKGKSAGNSSKHARITYEINIKYKRA